MAKNIYQWSPNSPEERCIVSTRFVPGTWCCRTEMSVFLSLSFSWRTPREWKLPDGFCSAPTSPCGGCQACTRMRRNLWHPEVVFGTQSALEKCLLELNHISPVPNKISQGSFSPWELLDLFHLSDSEDLYLFLLSLFWLGKTWTPEASFPLTCTGLRRALLLICIRHSIKALTSKDEIFKRVSWGASGSPPKCGFRLLCLKE